MTLQMARGEKITAALEAEIVEPVPGGCGPCVEFSNRDRNELKGPSEEWQLYATGESR